MFAVIESGGKQFKVAKNDVIEVEKLSVEVGAKVDLGRVLLLGGDGATVVGTPAVEGASVTAQVLDQTRGEKIIVFKKKRRKNYRRKQGHRQDLTVLRITEISPGGTKTAKAKPAAETKAETKQPETKQPETEKKAPAKKSAAKPKAAAKGETETKAKPKAKPKAKKAEEPKKTEEPKKAEEPKKTEEKD